MRVNKFIALFFSGTVALYDRRTMPGSVRCRQAVLEWCFMVIGKICVSDLSTARDLRAMG